MSSTSTAIRNDIEILTADDLSRVAGALQMDMDIGQVRDVLERFPGRSLWAPASRECLIVGEWRRRPEIASIVGVHAVGSRAELMRLAAQNAFESGHEALLTIEWNESLRPEFYASIDFDLIDAVIPFELTSAVAGSGRASGVAIESLDLLDDQVLEQVIAVDHSAFSWLWINSRSEFEHYGVSDGVELWGHVVDGELVSYTGITSYGQWGHIDRLAVRPDAQRRGFGDELTRFGIGRLRSKGARNIGLSTQVDNWRSQRLYSSLGFRRSSINMYRIYGRVFRNP